MIGPTLSLMRLSQRMARLGTETAFEVLVRARALEAQGRNVIHLEIGEPDFDTPPHIADAAVDGAARRGHPLRPLGRASRSCARRSRSTRRGGAASGPPRRWSWSRRARSRSSSS